MSTINSYQSLSSLYTQSSQIYGTRYQKQTQNLGTSGLQNDSGIGNKIEDTLSGLVTAGTISEDQEAAIKSAMENAIKSSAYARHKIQSNENGAERADPLASLVSAGTITQDQADAIKTAMDESMKSHRKQSTGSESDNPMLDVLNNLVTAGTITQDQADSIDSAFKDSMKSGGMPPPPPPPPQQQSDSSNSITDILDSLVTDGTINEEQETSISSLFQSAIKAYMAQSNSAYNLLNSNSTDMNL